jgi:hypothetical protein
MITKAAAATGSFMAKNGKWIIIGIVVLVIFYYSSTSISNWLKSMKSTEGLGNKGDLSGTNEGGELGGNGLGSQSTGGTFRADVIAKELLEALKGSFTSAMTKEEAAKRFYQLPYRNQMLEVWNYWNSNFAKEMNDETIYGSMEAEIITPSKFTNFGTKTYWNRTLELFEKDSKMNYKTLRS